MKLLEFPKFFVYDIYNRKIFQRSKMHNLPIDLKCDAFEHFNIGAVFAFAGVADPDLELLHNENVVDYYYCPIPDGKLYVDILERVHECVEIALEHLYGDEAILAHCNAGRNRSGFFNALLLTAYLKDIDGNAAVELVRRERPEAIDNDHFEKYLRSIA